MGFKRGEVDKTLFIQRTNHSILIAQIYVDDIVFGASSKKLLNEFVDCMSSTFEMSMVGELNYFLDLQIKQSKDGIFISQSKYVRNLVKKFNLDSASHMKTPMGSSQKLSREYVVESVDNTLYRSMIGSLLYLTASHPDIMYSVCLCVRYQANPKITHLKALKRIIRYIGGTSFTDANWASNLDDKRSTRDHCIYFGSNLLAWSSKKQSIVSKSSAESEYKSLFNA
ncbi:hypothetical protein DH2020_004953 [Rehmannia glutinosa]|uniref:Reverse transcriptase Ty1/copia-type domain-containing protein n=1 Tax=Rehmannia glutinosa TaxID=99300 RepID=A0ABR0XQX5_REHGL